MPVAANSLRNHLLASGPVLASLVLHGLLLALALLGLPPASADVPAIASISVELLSATQFAALLPAMPAPEVEAPPLVTADIPVVPTPPDQTIRAKQFFAGSALMEPGSERLLAAMETLAASERVVQLCDIEAMEQVRRARPEFDPDTVVPYAMAETRIESGTLVATGGAFRSRREWYEVSFRCTPSADLRQVHAFEFTIGASIPQEQWETHYLTAQEAE